MRGARVDAETRKLEGAAPRHLREPGWHLYLTLGAWSVAAASASATRVKDCSCPTGSSAPRSRHESRLPARHRVPSFCSLAPVADRPHGMARGRAWPWASSCSDSWRRSIWLLKAPPRRHGIGADGDRALTPAESERRPSNVVDPAWAAVDWTWLARHSTTRFWWIALGYFTGSLLLVRRCSAPDQVPDRDRLQPGYAAWALGFVSLAGIPGQIGLGYLSDRIGREWGVGGGGAGIRRLLHRAPPHARVHRRLRSSTSWPLPGGARLWSHLRRRRHSRGDLPGQALRYGFSAP